MQYCAHNLPSLISPVWQIRRGCRCLPAQHQSGLVASCFVLGVSREKSGLVQLGLPQSRQVDCNGINLEWGRGRRTNHMAPPATPSKWQTRSRCQKNPEARTRSENRAHTIQFSLVCSCSIDTLPIFCTSDKHHPTTNPSAVANTTSVTMKLNISYPANGSQKLVEIEDERKLRDFMEKRVCEQKARNFPTKPDPPCQKK